MINFAYTNNKTTNIMKAVKLTSNDLSSGSAFYGSTINATTNELRKLFGDEADGDPYGKVQHEWGIDGEMDDDSIYEFSIYDWKEYREYSDDEMIEWHIGGENKTLTDAVKKKIEEMLAGIR